MFSIADPIHPLLVSVAKSIIAFVLKDAPALLVAQRAMYAGTAV